MDNPQCVTKSGGDRHTQGYLFLAACFAIVFLFPVAELQKNKVPNTVHNAA